jgi:crossover junction endodeoxyribonuclease RuvC
VKVVRILGIDPGSRLTGYGIVDMVGNQLKHVTHGTLKLSNTGGRATIPLEERLLLIYQGLTQVIEEFKPHVMSVERVFFAKNAVSALKLGQARGAAILSGAIHGLDMVEYSPSEVKSIIVGHGQADKEQVAKMLQLLVGVQVFATSDASDGLALAVCHAQMIASKGSRALTDASSLSNKVKGTQARKGRSTSLAESLGVTADMIEGKKSIRLTRERS